MPVLQLGVVFRYVSGVLVWLFKIGGTRTNGVLGFVLESGFGVGVEGGKLGLEVFGWEIGGAGQAFRVTDGCFKGLYLLLGQARLDAELWGLEHLLVQKAFTVILLFVGVLLRE